MIVTNVKNPQKRFHRWGLSTKEAKLRYYGVNRTEAVKVLWFGTTFVCRRNVFASVAFLFVYQDDVV